MKMRNEALASAQKARDKAIAPAQKVYNEAIARIEAEEGAT
jgi:hypothetical protein